MGVTHTGVVTGTGVFTIESLTGGRGTKFTWTEDLDFPWYLGGRPGEIVAGKFLLDHIWKRNLAELKRLVDGH